MTELLDDDRIRTALEHLPHWQRDGDAITREAKLPSFPRAIEVVNRVAELAEAADHHPDVDIRWRTLRFSLSTHSAGGLTEKDISLATEIDGVVDAVMDAT
ncbi:4a-hydroxytetrahydrobiopterin dehydratase [Prauserella rugosa]|uniref:Putative pterin-4-alpha-carbinolamine dehydratase n=1 Tax=Prauserella rugosa TaxID=43354 RepID=A0A660CAF7_9PSEU|nr:4a-hydroxytetrahydrobiopterin dehydratase [Prauserella rugosa]KID28413.1 pterin-4a-carbinolamine dehydratase [Prauserella sp. Am3]KMS85523.1 pterin-4-alpha-carbinolamine dehydratase [Streptomyces regensis]TWH20590.1 4a-hydroxytetrahydrobiopterin dehydratase [Prauserella rugosa]